MKLGLFLIPSHPPERSTWDARQCDLDCLEMADRYGLSEAWIGEHHARTRESPDTVEEKLRALYDAVGGFGTLLWLTFDHSEDRESYEKSVRLLSQEVMPRLADLSSA